jgi:hypothetical protein
MSAAAAAGAEVPA